MLERDDLDYNKTGSISGQEFREAILRSLFFLDQKNVKKYLQEIRGE